MPQSEEVKTPKTFLIVDDDKTIRRVVSQFLSKDYPEVRILEACDGLEGVDRLMKEKIDLVILDVRMPRMNGLEVASFIRRNPSTADLKILMFTSEKDEHTRNKARAQGVNHYIQKPFTPDKFKGIIDDILATDTDSPIRSSPESTNQFPLP